MVALAGAVRPRSNRTERLVEAGNRSAWRPAKSFDGRVGVRLMVVGGRRMGRKCGCALSFSGTAERIIMMRNYAAHLPLHQRLVRVLLADGDHRVLARRHRFLAYRPVAGDVSRIHARVVGALQATLLAVALVDLARTVGAGCDATQFEQLIGRTVAGVQRGWWGMRQSRGKRLWLVLLSVQSFDA